MMTRRNRKNDLLSDWDSPAFYGEADAVQRAEENLRHTAVSSYRLLVSYDYSFAIAPTTFSRRRSGARTAGAREQAGWRRTKKDGVAKMTHNFAMLGWCKKKVGRGHVY
jgi:hypothetical protein